MTVSSYHGQSVNMVHLLIADAGFQRHIRTIASTSTKDLPS